MKYVPTDIAVLDMFHCERIAERAAMDGLKAKTLINDNEEGFYDWFEYEMWIIKFWNEFAFFQSIYSTIRCHSSMTFWFWFWG